MDPSLFADDDLPLSRKSVLPGAGFFVPDEIRDRERDTEAAAALEEHETAVIADPDADGLASAAIVQAVEGEIALLPSGPHDLHQALTRAQTFGSDELTLYVCDLAPDRYDRIADAIEAMLATGATVEWIDHHQWPEAVETAIRDAGVSLTIGDSEHECTADVAVRVLGDAVPEHLRAVAAVVRDHDLWIKDDPRSDDLADLAYWMEPAEFVETILEHGVDLPDDVSAFLDEQREEKQALIARAVDRARLVEVGPWTVGVTYGRCSQNEVAEALRQSGADASIIVKPAGSASIRGSETFERCHEVAQQVGGGGHPRAAGCKPPIYDDMLDYAHHWVTQGAVTQRTILEAFHALDRS